MEAVRLLDSWQQHQRSRERPCTCVWVSPHIYTSHCRSQGQRQEESGSDGTHRRLSCRGFHSGCSLTTSFSILDSAEGWGQHQGSAMEALVPAPVGEGHQLLDPLPLTVPPLHLCLIAWALLFLLLGDEAQSGRYSAICPSSLSMSSRAPI